MKILLIFTVYLISGQVGCVDIVGYPGRSVLISCNYSALHEARSKVVCRRAQICETVIITNTSNQWIHKDRFHLYADSAAAVITVLIRNLSLRDAGPYRCAVVLDSAYRSVGDWELKVEEDSCCGESLTVTAQLGQNVSFSFGYSEINSTKFKPNYLLTLHENSIEHRVSTTGTPAILDEQMRRFSISDNTDTKMVSVTIKNLTVDDAGLYFCEVHISGSPVSYTSAIRNVHLIITGSKVTGNEGATVEIRCPYAHKYKQKLRHLCKKECSTHLNNSLTSQPPTLNKPERFFSANISGVTAEDAGKYWCGVETGDVLVNYLSTELQVIMKEVLQITGRETINLTINCKSRRESVRSDGRFFCLGQQISSCDEGGVRVSSETDRNGRFSLSDDAPAGVFTVTITDLRVEDSGTYWCGEESGGSTIYTKVHLQVTKDSPVISITLWLCLALLLIGGLILMLYKLRCDKTQGSTPSSARMDLEDNNETAVVCNHEEVHLSALNVQSVVTDPTYTSVAFQKNPASLSDAVVSFSEEEPATEYATVRRHTELK